MKHLVLVFFGLLIHGSLSAQNLFSNCSVTGSTTIYDYKNKNGFLQIVLMLTRVLCQPLHLRLLIL